MHFEIECVGQQGQNARGRLRERNTMKIRIALLVLAVMFVNGCKKELPGSVSPADTEKTAQQAPAVCVDEDASTAVAVAKEPVDVATEAVAEEEKKGAHLGQAAATLDGMEWVKGDPVEFQDGKVYVVEFWATWCPPCRTSIPHLTELQHKYKDKGVTIVGISTENDSEKVKKFVAEWDTRMDYTVAIDASRSVSKHYTEAFGAGGIPHAFIVDGQGKIAWHGHPMVGMDKILGQVVAGTFDRKAYAEELQLKKEIDKLMNDYYTSIQKGDDSAASATIAKSIIEKAPASNLNSLSWTIMTRVPEDKRDMKIALQAAAKANTLAQGKDPMILDTYALALFKNKQIDKAIVQQQKAVELSKGHEQLHSQLAKQLEKYKNAM